MKIFENITTLKQSHLKEGQLVETKGGSTAGDGNGGRYLIKTSVQHGSSANETTDFVLANNNIAVLQTVNRSRLPLATTSLAGAMSNADKTKLNGLGTAATSDVTTSATDTTAGRLLKVGDFGLGSGIRLSSGSADDYTQSGLYFLVDQITNKPVTGGGNLFVSRDQPASEIVSQIFVHRGGDRSIWYRNKDISGVWGAWRQIYHSANILGTVSQSDGVPTGAIIQRGSNANGEFVKYADGTMWCFVSTIEATFASTTALEASWTFPASFVSASTVIPSVLTSPLNGRRSFHVRADFNRITNSRITAHANPDTFSSGDTANFQVTAIGRWY